MKSKDVLLERMKQCNICVNIVDGVPYYTVMGGDPASVTMALADACGAIFAEIQNICGKEGFNRNVIVVAFAEATRVSWEENYDRLQGGKR